jgi:tRNA-dihydrouridine synthase
MRKHVAWYVKGLPGAGAVRDRANHIESRAELEELLLGYLARLEADQRGVAGPAAAPAGRT